MITNRISGLVYHRRLPLIVLVVSVVACLLAVQMFWPSFGNALPCLHCLQVSVLDIGQGDSIYVRAPNGNSLLVDAGPPGGQVSRRISESAVTMFDTSIDVMIATHPDADHIGGFKEVLQHFDAGMLIDSGTEVQTAIYKNMMEEISAKHIPHVVAQRGMNIVLDKDANVVFHILYPSDDYFFYKFKECEAANTERKRLHKKGSLKKCENVYKVDTNTMSVVGKLTYGNTRFVLTGDSPVEVEKYLVDAEKVASSSVSLSADVLKVGHHGSKSSTSKEFVEAVSPEFAAISVGAKNKYGHPAEQVLKILTEANFATSSVVSSTSSTASSSIQILRTDQLGTIHFISDGYKVWVKK